MRKKLPPLHPGEILREEFLVPLRLSPGALAKAMGVPRTRVERIAAESIGITADTALRLSEQLRNLSLVKSSGLKNSDRRGQNLRRNFILVGIFHVSRSRFHRITPQLRANCRRTFSRSGHSFRPLGFPRPSIRHVCRVQT